MMNTASLSLIKKLLILFLVLAGVYYARAFLMPLAVGGLIATLFLPFCRWMEKYKFPRIVAALICLVVLLLAVSGIFALISWQFSEVTQDISLIRQKANAAIDKIQEFIYTNLGISHDKQKQMLQDQESSVGGMLSSFAGSLANIFTNIILVLVYMILFLYYRTHIRDFVLKLYAPAQKKEVSKVFYSATYVSQQYLLGLIKMIGLLWVMYSIGFSIVGVENAFFFAILCGLLEIVPFIGNITGTTLTVLVSAVKGASLGMLGGIIITYGIVQFIQGWVLEPLIVGPQVKINSFATIIALVLGNLFWGIPGIVLAIPLTGMLKIVCDHIEPLKPYGFLIGEIDTKRRESALVKKIKALMHIK